MKVRVVVVGDPPRLLISLKDNLNKCLLEVEAHRRPPNFRQNNRAYERWALKKVNEFLADCHTTLGISLDYFHKTDASLFGRAKAAATQKLKRRLRNAPAQ